MRNNVMNMLFIKSGVCIYLRQTVSTTGTSLYNQYEICDEPSRIYTAGNKTCPCFVIINSVTKLRMGQGTKGSICKQAGWNACVKWNDLTSLHTKQYKCKTQNKLNNKGHKMHKKWKVWVLNSLTGLCTQQWYSSVENQYQEQQAQLWFAVDGQTAAHLIFPIAACALQLCGQYPVQRNNKLPSYTSLIWLCDFNHNYCYHVSYSLVPRAWLSRLLPLLTYSRLFFTAQIFLIQYVH